MKSIFKLIKNMKHTYDKKFTLKYVCTVCYTLEHNEVCKKYCKNKTVHNRSKLDGFLISDVHGFFRSSLFFTDLILIV